jgi:hypothetical protein
MALLVHPGLNNSLNFFAILARAIRFHCHANYQTLEVWSLMKCLVTGLSGEVETDTSKLRSRRLH